jgi:hypothetical protein
MYQITFQFLCPKISLSRHYITGFSSKAAGYILVCLTSLVARPELSSCISYQLLTATAQTD